MQITINVPDNLPTEFLKLRITEIEANLKAEAVFFTHYAFINQETVLAIESVEKGDIEKVSLQELRALAELS